MRLREVGTIAGCFLLLEAALWSPPPRQIVLGICSVLAMTVATFTRHVPLRELGLDASAWRRGAWIIAACSLAAIAMLTASFLFGTLQPLSSNRSDGFRSLAYAAWAFEQQFMLQSFIFVGMERAFGVRWAVVTSGLLFGFAHLPNPALFPVTLVGGYFSAIAFARYRSVYVLAVAHAILGLTFAVTVPEQIHHRMRVGWGYSRYVASQTVESPAPAPADLTTQQAKETQR